VREINTFATGGLTPDRTLLLRLPPEQGRARSRNRITPPDRLEREADEFFARIAAAYDELAAAEPTRIAVIDASREPAQVLADARAAIADLI
jgi:dTMP kinase